MSHDNYELRSRDRLKLEPSEGGGAAVVPFNSHRFGGVTSGGVGGHGGSRSSICILVRFGSLLGQTLRGQRVFS